MLGGTAGSTPPARRPPRGPRARPSTWRRRTAGGGRWRDRGLAGSRFEEARRSRRDSQGLLLGLRERRHRGRRRRWQQEVGGKLHAALDVADVLVAVGR